MLSDSNTAYGSALTSGGLDGAKKAQEETPEHGSLLPPMGIAASNAPSRWGPPTGSGSTIHHPPHPTLRNGVYVETIPSLTVSNPHCTLFHYVPDLLCPINSKPRSHCPVPLSTPLCGLVPTVPYITIAAATPLYNWDLDHHTSNFPLVPPQIYHMWCSAATGRCFCGTCVLTTPSSSCP